MSPSAPLILSFMLALAKLGSAGTLCPKVNSIGHAQPQQWVFSNLNWTLVQGKDTMPSTKGGDLVGVSFDIRSDFNDASVSCTAVGAEFGEEYIRGAAGAPITYNWYECKGESKAVETKFQMVWWDQHTLELNQTWTCDDGSGKLIPYRATGKTSILGTFDCDFNPDSQARVRCLARSKPTGEKAIPADVVQLLPPPTRNCAAKSIATPNWQVYDLKWSNNFSPPDSIFRIVGQNMTFRLVNEALGYSPRMVCDAPVMLPQPGWEFDTWYGCNVFEADFRDVPKTEFNWVEDERKLTVRQTWMCSDGAEGSQTFNSQGSVVIGPMLDCASVLVQHEFFNETVTTCSTKNSFQIKGKLQ